MKAPAPNGHKLNNQLAMIAETAYFKAEKHRFSVGHEIDDLQKCEQEFANIMDQDMTWSNTDTDNDNVILGNVTVRSGLAHHTQALIEYLV